MSLTMIVAIFFLFCSYTLTAIAAYMSFQQEDSHRARRGLALRHAHPRLKAAIWPLFLGALR